MRYYLGRKSLKTGVILPTSSLKLSSKAGRCLIHRSQLAMTTAALLHHLSDGLAAGRGAGIAAEIPGAQRAFAERALDRSHDRRRGGLLAAMLQHHGAGPDHADRVRNALPRDIGRGAMHRLEPPRANA